MMQRTFLIAAGKRIGRASHRLAAASWRSASFLSVTATQAMTVSMVGALLLLTLACSLYAIGMGLGHVGGVLRSSALVAAVNEN
ncbi:MULTISPECIES: hypothetical protein [Cupriavidus]|uniref:hypothetical protein n=1 Tax=Cupriavidus TaxID=106589 RepID=UPI000566B5DE|nr:MULTISPECIES: hypothetical protein [Cupriavidus]MDF3887342.1 hypothetical protein [Cupriavidus basilensis]